MPDFQPLPIDKGVGVFHLNRFRVIIESPGDDARRLALANGLLNKFPAYMNTEAASVTLRHDRRYLIPGLPTLRFVGNIKLRPDTGVIPLPDVVRDVLAPDLHSDWVGVIARDTKSGFTVQTLKRLFYEPLEASALLVTTKPLATPPGRFPAVLPLIDLNQMHFLAGRRAWRLDVGTNFGYSKDFWALETVAIERFSHSAFLRSEFLAGDFKPILRNVWVKMLLNFVRKEGLAAVDIPAGAARPAGPWTVQERVHCLQCDFMDKAAVKASLQYADMARLHASILD